MSDTKITQKYIFDIARSKEVDKNQNGQLEGDEISIFEKKLEWKIHPGGKTEENYHIFMSLP